MTPLESTCEAIKQLAGEVPAQELPRLLGELEQAKAIAFSRLTQSITPAQPQNDELLDIAEASRRLGLSKSYLYRHHQKFPFTRHIGRKLLFSAQGLEKHIQK